MLSTGINTTEQIVKTNTRDNKQLSRELSLKSMMNSCFSYGGMDSFKTESYDYNKYILSHKTQLGDNLFHEILKEQKAFLSKCKIKSGVYTDSEDCTYNEIVYPE